MEKIYQKTKSKADSKIFEIFSLCTDQALVQKISMPFLTQHLLPYWKQGKRFTRKFWENPDANAPDVTAAFRKRPEV